MTISAKLFVKCLENEGVEFIFGIPGEEKLHVMNALLDSSIKFITYFGASFCRQYRGCD